MGSGQLPYRSIFLKELQLIRYFQAINLADNLFPRSPPSSCEPPEIRTNIAQFLKLKNSRSICLFSGNGLKISLVRTGVHRNALSTTLVHPTQDVYADCKALTLHSRAMLVHQPIDGRAFKTSSLTGLRKQPMLSGSTGLGALFNIHDGQRVRDVLISLEVLILVGFDVDHNMLGTLQLIPSPSISLVPLSSLHQVLLSLSSPRTL